MTYADLSKIRYWVDQYGNAGIPDKQAVELFIDCETREMVSPLQAQLYAVAQGLCDEEQIERVAGKKRKVKHGSYVDWAKFMLLWISGYKG